MFLKSKLFINNKLSYLTLMNVVSEPSQFILSYNQGILIFSQFIWIYLQVFDCWWNTTVFLSIDIDMRIFFFFERILAYFIIINC